MAKLDRFIIDDTTYELVPEIAPLFDPATPYSVGDCVIHDAVLYKFTANHAAGAWTGNDVTAFEVGSELVRLGSGASGSGLTEDVKVALLACFEKVAWIDEDGQDYYDALYNALYPPADLVSISAVFTQGSAVIYDTDSLDTLKQYLVVTAHMSDSSTQTVTTYVLSGTLSAGTSTITVTYDGKTTTFNATVTENTMPYVTSGLIHMWDGIDNTLNGHDSSASTWYDLVGGLNLIKNGSSISWVNGNAVNVPDALNQYFSNTGGAISCVGKTCEVVFAPSKSQTSALTTLFSDGAAQGKVCIYSDNTFSVRGASGKTYLSGESSITDLHYICGTFDSNGNINTVYSNGVPATVSSNTHSLSGQASNIIIGQADQGYRYQGKIYAVRIYDRILSSSEVASNYATDVNRFGI